MIKHYQAIRTEAAQAFQESLHQLEERLLASEDDVKAAPEDRLPLNTQTGQHLSPHSTASTQATSVSLQEFNLDVLQDAAADIDQFIQSQD